MPAYSANFDTNIFFKDMAAGVFKVYTTDTAYDNTIQNMKFTL